MSTPRDTLEFSQTDSVASRTTISYGFSRGRTKNPKEILLEAIRESTQSLDVAVYTFTDAEIASAVIKAHRRGVKVRIVTDVQQSRHEHQRRVISDIISEGIIVKINTHQEAFLHLKVIVVDGKTITTGSLNFSKAAVNKHEGVLLRIDDVKIARDWKKHFEYRWDDQARYKIHNTIGTTRYA